jgi:addiction module HigA family antidote
VIKTFANRRTQELFAKGRATGFPPDVARRAARKLEYVSGSSTVTPTTSRSAIITEREKTMSVANTKPMTRRPTHPGEMLREDFLPDYGLTIAGLAEAVAVSRQTINELLRARRAVSPEMALRLGRLFGNTPEFWLNAQRAVDLWDAEQAIRDDVARITPLQVA